ncbi:MAG: HNH endonuclease [Bdellovibrio sp.]|nr:HNH endonuclease [Bdellovibrio sp.]
MFSIYYHEVKRFFMATSGVRIAALLMLNFTATVAVELNNKGPSLLDIKLVKRQQTCCQYIDPQSGQRCKSTWKLQIDHKQSRWAGGDHSKNNLQLLCSSARMATQTKKQNPV